jgi:hypothetical protein
LAHFLSSCLGRNIVYVYSKRPFPRGLSTKIIFSIIILYALSFSPSSPLVLMNDRHPGFRRHANAICALLGFYVAQNGSSGAMLQGSVSVPNSRRMRACASPAFSLDCLTPEGHLHCVKSQKRADLMDFLNSLSQQYYVTCTKYIIPCNVLSYTATLSPSLNPVTFLDISRENRY